MKLMQSFWMITPEWQTATCIGLGRRCLLSSCDPFRNLLHFWVGERIHNIEPDRFASHRSLCYRWNDSHNCIHIATGSVHVNSRARDSFNSIAEVENHVFGCLVHSTIRVPQRVVPFVAMETRKLNFGTGEKAACLNGHVLPVMLSPELQYCKIESQFPLGWGWFLPFLGNVSFLHADPVESPWSLKQT